MPALSHHHAPLTQLFKIPSKPIYSTEVPLSQTSSISTLQVRALCPVSLQRLQRLSPCTLFDSPSPLPLCCLNKVGPALDNRWILAGSSLMIIGTAPSCSQLRGPLNEVINPFLANRLAAPLMQHFISHCANVSLCRRKSSGRLLKNTSNYRVLL